MTDIVERLQAPVDETKPVLVLWEMISQRKEAAAEIERLQERINDVWAEVKERDVKIDQQRAEIERLRAALQLAAEHLASEGYSIEADMARRALEPKP